VGRRVSATDVLAYRDEGTDRSSQHAHADTLGHSSLSPPALSKSAPSDAGRQLDEGPQSVDVSALLTTADRVDDANVQALVRAQRVPSTRELPPEVLRRRVADPEAEVDERVARGARRDFHRQPEVYDGVDDDVIGGQASERKHVGVSPCTAIKAICNSTATGIMLTKDRKKN